MIRKRVILLLISFCFMLSQIGAQANNYFLHTVTASENLYSIAGMYNVTPEKIRVLNPGISSIPTIGTQIKIPQSKSTYLFHTIAAGETLYGVAQKYNTEIDSILEINSGLSKENFSIGKVIRVHPNNKKVTEAVFQALPQSKEQKTHTVARKETFYSIARQYEVTPKELEEANPGVNSLKPGMKLVIPQPKSAATPQVEPKPVDTPKRYKYLKDNEMNVVLMLPFRLNERQDTKSSLYIEFYEGLLLAVDSLKKTGANFNIYALDTEGNDAKISNYLKSDELSNADLIIGLVEESSIARVAEFAKNKGINMINAFSLRSEEVFNTPSVFQVNVPHSYLYAQVAKEFVRLYADREVVFVQDSITKGDKEDFIEVLSAELSSKGVPYWRVNVDAMPQEPTNVNKRVYVPVSGNQQLVKKLIPILRSNAYNQQPDQTNLFGYPEWQTYTKEFIEGFYALNTRIFSRFYADETSLDTKRFFNKFKYWYSRDLLPSSPKYGMLGYDTGLYFLTALKKYGREFHLELPKIQQKGLQTDFVFKQINNWGGYVNKAVYMINFNPDYQIKRTRIGSYNNVVR